MSHKLSLYHKSRNQLAKSIFEMTKSMVYKPSHPQLKFKMKILIMLFKNATLKDIEKLH